MGHPDKYLTIGTLVRTSALQRRPTTRSPGELWVIRALLRGTKTGHEDDALYDCTSLTDGHSERWFRDELEVHNEGGS